MTSFKLARRSFLCAVGGALGLRVLLDDMLASAAGASSPPRFLMTHWPLGTVRYLFKPTGSGQDYTASPILQPFVDAGLRPDMTVLYGLSQSMSKSLGGGQESGTVMMVTGHEVAGTRANGGEGDDGVAGGPSFDQIFLKNVPELHRPGVGYANAICDARVDSFETSTQCLSYSYATRTIEAATVGVPTLTESIPLLPALSPFKLYTSLFAGFMPGGATAKNQEELARALKRSKSVLDFSLRELQRLRDLAPASERVKIDAHADAVRKAEQALSGEPIPDPNGSCVLPATPDASIVAKRGSKYDYTGQPVEAAESDEVMLAQIGKLHMSTLIAAFQCDLLRVATFQWVPGTNHVSFKGLYPGAPDKIFMHHPTSAAINDPKLTLGPSLPSGKEGEVIQFLANVQTWFNTQHAALLLALKQSKDAWGNSLLDHTVVPYLTEIADCTDQRSPLPAFIFGGRALGMQHGSFLDFEQKPRCQNDLWLTIAQAYLGADPLAKLTSETFYKTNVTPIEGLWQKPA